MSDLNVEGLNIAPNVWETIVSLATREVDGVASLAQSPAAGLMSILGAKPSTEGIDIAVSESGSLDVAVHIEVLYGYSLPQIAEDVRTSIAEAVTMQVGVEVSNIDVFIDGIQFPK